MILHLSYYCTPIMFYALGQRSLKKDYVLCPHILCLICFLIFPNSYQMNMCRKVLFKQCTWKIMKNNNFLIYTDPYLTPHAQTLLSVS